MKCFSPGVVHSKHILLVKLQQFEHAGNFTVEIYICGLRVYELYAY
jgi:hypothetical protein